MAHEIDKDLALAATVEWIQGRYGDEGTYMYGPNADETDLGWMPAAKTALALVEQGADPSGYFHTQTVLSACKRALKAQQRKAAKS